MEAKECCDGWGWLARIQAQLVAMEHGGATKLMLLLVLCVSSWQVGARDAAASGGGRPRVPAILVFGDSIVDTGNNNAVLTLTKSDFRPYGKDLNGGVPTGRFSNGRVPSDFVGAFPQPWSHRVNAYDFSGLDDGFHSVCMQRHGSA